MIEYTATELMAAKIAILRGRVELSIANDTGSAMLETIVDKLTHESRSNGVIATLTIEQAGAIVMAAQTWLHDALAAIDDDAAIERIEADRAAQAGPSLGVVDRIAERVE